MSSTLAPSLTFGIARTGQGRVSRSSRSPLAATKASGDSATDRTETKFRGLFQPVDPRSLNYGPTRVRDPYFGKADWLDGTLPGDVGIDLLQWSKTPEALAKNRERELFHGRLAMLGVAGALAQENAGFGPWFRAGAEICAPVDWLNFGSWLLTTTCTVPGYWGVDALNFSLPLGTIIFFEIAFFGVAEAFRTGLYDDSKGPHEVTTRQMLSKNFPMDDIIDGEEGRMYPGVHEYSFNPLKISANLDMLKVMEIKHSRLAMFAWLGFIVQACVTNPVVNGLPVDGVWHGATDNLMAVADSPAAAGALASFIIAGHVAPLAAQSLDYSTDAWQLWRPENKDGVYLTRMPASVGAKQEPEVNAALDAARAFIGADDEQAAAVAEASKPEAAAPEEATAPEEAAAPEEQAVKEPVMEKETSE